MKSNKKDYKARFISSWFILALFGVMAFMFGIASILWTIFVLVYESYDLLFANVLFVAPVILGVIGCKTVYFVKVYDDKLTFKSLFGKEKTLYISDVKRVYNYFVPRMGRVYLIGTRDVDIFTSDVIGTELREPEILKLGYPFMFEVNKNTTDLVRSFKKPIIYVKYFRASAE